MPENSTEVPSSDTQNTIPDPPNTTPPVPVHGVNPVNEVNTGQPPAFTSESSALKASKEDFVKRSLKGGKGGNKDTATGMTTAVVKPEIPIPIPSPKFTVFKRDAPSPAQDSSRFYNYWNQLPGWGRDRTICYVYRDWPVLKQLPEGSKEFVYIDKISGNEPLQDDIDLMNMYGAGSYKLMFNEQSPTGRNLCTVYVANLGMNDLKSHPPVDRRISDVNNVDMDFPGNKSYIEFLRMAGKLPEQSKGKEAEAEMAAINLVEKLQDRNDALIDKALEAAKGNRRDAEPTEQAIAKAIDVVSDGAKRSNAMLSEAYQTIKATREEGQNSATETLNLAIQLAREFAGANGGARAGDNDEVKELRARLDKIQDDRMAALERQLADAKTQPAAGAGSSPFSSAKEGLSTIKEMKSMLEELGLSGKEPTVAEEVADAAGMPKWLPKVLEMGMPLLNNLTMMFMASRGVTPVMPPPGPPQGMGGQPFPIQPGQGQPMPQPQRPMQPNPQQQAQGQPGLPPPQPVPSATPDFSPSGTPTYGLHPDIADILFEIKTPLTQYLAAGATGEDYAPVFCDNYGIDSFTMVTGFGVDGLMGAITNYPPITARLNALAIPLDRLTKFVTEFVEFKPELEPEEGGGDVEIGPAA